MKDSLVDFRSLCVIVFVCARSCFGSCEQVASNLTIETTARVRRDINFFESQPPKTSDNQQQLIFPQTRQPPRQPQQQPPFYLTNPLNEPANIPTSLNQHDTRFYDQFAQNQPTVNLQEPPLDLAHINNRSPAPVATSGQPEAAPSKGSHWSRQIHPPNNQQQQQQQQQQSRQLNMPQHQARSDQVGDIRRFDDFAWPVKKGKVNDVPALDPRMIKFAPLGPALGPFGNKLGPIAYKSQDCITRSAPLATRCEDHLIKRLNQDATEGRTVLDVGRRYCCALFWHKDCISRLVVENCPDSSPVASDILMGSRRLDLTNSCKNFNRDGCNGSSILSQSLASWSIPFVTSSLLLIFFMEI